MPVADTYSDSRSMPNDAVRSDSRPARSRASMTSRYTSEFGVNGSRARVSRAAPGYRANAASVSRISCVSCSCQRAGSGSGSGTSPTIRS